MPDDLRIQAVNLDREVAKLAVKLHEHMTTSIEALCVPDSHPVPCGSAKAARPSSTSAASPSAMARAASQASSSSTASAGKASGSCPAPGQGVFVSTASNSAASAGKASGSRPAPGQDAPAKAAGSATQTRAPSGSTNAACKAAGKTETKSAGDTGFGAALRQAFAPKKEDAAASSSAQHQSASEPPSNALQAKQWANSRLPGANFQSYFIEPDGSVQHAGDPIMPLEGLSQPDVEEGASKQERKRLKRRAQKLRQQQRAQVDTSHVNVWHGLQFHCATMAACCCCLHNFHALK